MALKIRIFGKQFGFGIAESMLGMALGAVIIGGGVSYFGEVSEAAASSTILQDKTSKVTESLNRTAQNVQVSDPVLYAAPDQLMTSSADGAGNKIMTRWVKASNSYIQQTWTGLTGDYMPDPGLWIATSVLEGPAPNGDGRQSTMTLIPDMAATGTPIFAYSSATGTVIDASVAPLTTTAGNVNQIKLVNITLASATVAPQFYANSTSAAPRNTAAGVSDGTVIAPVCPAVNFTAASTPTQPELSWTAIPGAVSYVIYRNSTIAATPAAPATTWKDTANPAGVTDSTTYQVLAKSAAGTTSDSCRPAVWRPQIGQPVLRSSTVLPGGTNSNGWNGSPLVTPRISLAWDAVAGTSGYELLYREVTNPAGAPIGSGAYTNIQLDATKLSFIFDTAGFGKRYEWYLRANARSGQSGESRTIQILTHPAAPVAAATTASYGDNTNGKNNLSWGAVSTATRYDIYRYVTGTTGATTLVGITSSLTYTDSVPYGSNYTYFIGARNYGPRGTDAAGTDVNEDRGSPTPESAASSKPAKITQLQYPPIPVMTMASASGTTSRDSDGYNHIVWGAATSATGYQVGRFTVGGAALTCVSGADCNADSGGITATFLNSNAAKGTQYDYAVLAYNATGRSIAFSAKARLTQRPAAPPLTLTRAPDLSNDSANFSTVQNADAGNSGANLFCAPETCIYELQRDGVTAVNTAHAQSNSALAWNNVANAQGATINYRARAKNAAITNGGWSDTTGTVVNTYPGPFATGQSLGDRNGWGQTRFRVDVVSTDTSGSSTGIQNGYTTLWYGASAGATWFDFSRSAEAWDSNSGNGDYGLPSSTWLYGSYGGGGANNWTVIAAPGALYHHDVVAHAANGLARGVVTGGYWTPPDVPRFGTTMITCSGNQYTNQTTAYWDWPNHHIGARLIAFDKNPRYGAFTATGIIGMSSNRWTGGWNDTSWTQLEWWQGNPDWNSGLASGPGQGYYFGVNSGFRLWNNAPGGNSTILMQSIQALATFNEGCGPYGGWWYDMYEPRWACYGYVPGQPCMANNPWNRPQWMSF